MPRLVFNPDYFRRLEGDRLQYVVKPDTRLIRIGHPLMRKALNLFKKSLWEMSQKDAGRTVVNRISLGATDLPSGLHEIAVLFTLVECYNQLRESVHQQVVAFPVLVEGNKLTPVLPEIWARVENATMLPLEANALQEWLPRIKKQWTLITEHFTAEMTGQRKSIQKELESQLGRLRKSEETRIRKSYQQRLEELKHRTEADYVLKHRNQLIKERMELQQATLFAYTERERAERIREIEANLESLIGTKVEYLQSVLNQEMERTLNVVIPKRFAIGYLDVQPLGVEVLLNKNLLKK
ncbi:MAG: hypothetical protein V1799_00515 [bacterium]